MPCSVEILMFQVNHGMTFSESLKMETAGSPRKLV